MRELRQKKRTPANVNIKISKHQLILYIRNENWQSKLNPKRETEGANNERGDKIVKRKSTGRTYETRCWLFEKINNIDKQQIDQEKNRKGANKSY